MKTVELRNRYRRLFVSSALLLAATFNFYPAFAEDAGRDQAALIKALAQSKITLLDGLRQATKPPEVPISAKFEFDDAGKLSLSVYTAEKGLAVDAEHNVLKELSGSPEQSKWAPQVEVFKDPPHVARSSEQLALMSLSPFTLASIAAKAQKEHLGIVFSITPAVRNHKPVFVVLEAEKGKVTQLVYGAMDGKLVQSRN